MTNSDHPRSCGANGGTGSTPASSRGSSPLVRGQLLPHRRHVAADRIIPARAGPTRASCTRSNVRQDHPRSCGANYVTDLEGLKDCGSSSLVRGQQVAISSLERLIRIIPARAGPT